MTSILIASSPRPHKHAACDSLTSSQLICWQKGTFTFTSLKHTGAAGAAESNVSPQAKGSLWLRIYRSSKPCSIKEQSKNIFILCLKSCWEVKTPTVQCPYLLPSPTFAGCLDAHWLEASVEGRGIDDVRIKVTMVLPVDEERHGDRNNQAHDHRDDNAHIQGYIICTRRHWRRKRDRTQREESSFRILYIHINVH